MMKANHDWDTHARWRGIKRDYQSADVAALQASLKVEYSVAKYTAKKLWLEIHEKEPVRALGALTGAQAVNMVRGGLKSIYLSG